MKKIAIVIVALCMVLSLIVGGVASAAAQKLDLRAAPPTWGVPDETSPVAGFVVLNNDNEADNVVVVVSLKDGVPGRIYRAYLEEYRDAVPDGKMPKYKYLGDLTANVRGKGNFKAEVPMIPGTYYLQLVLSYPWGRWGADSFGTDIATITIK